MRYSSRSGWSLFYDRSGCCLFASCLCSVSFPVEQVSINNRHGNVKLQLSLREMCVFLIYCVSVFKWDLMLRLGNITFQLGNNWTTCLHLLHQSALQSELSGVNNRSCTFIRLFKAGWAAAVSFSGNNLCYRRWVYNWSSSLQPLTSFLFHRMVCCWRKRASRFMKCIICPTHHHGSKKPGPWFAEKHPKRWALYSRRRSKSRKTRFILMSLVRFYFLNLGSKNDTICHINVQTKLWSENHEDGPRRCCSVILYFKTTHKRQRS